MRWLMQTGATIEEDIVMDDNLLNSNQKQSEFKFVNGPNDMRGSAQAIINALKILMDYAGIDVKVTEISLSVTSEPVVQKDGLSGISAEELSNRIDDLKKSSGRLDIPLITAEQATKMRAPRFDEFAAFRKRITSLIEKVEARDDIDETQASEIRIVINYEFNRRRYGVGCMLRSKEQWGDWVNRAEELTESLLNKDITIHMFKEQLKEEY